MTGDRPDKSLEPTAVAPSVLTMIAGLNIVFQPKPG
jgi:hypothetical protein